MTGKQTNFTVNGVLLSYQYPDATKATDIRIFPLALYYDHYNPDHGRSWILRAHNHDKSEMEEFAMKNITGWAEWL